MKDAMTMYHADVSLREARALGTERLGAHQFALAQYIYKY